MGARLIDPVAEFAVTTARSRFPVRFKIMDESDLRVTVDGLALSPNDFTFEGNLPRFPGYDDSAALSADPNWIMNHRGVPAYRGGTVVLNVPAENATVRIWSDPVPARPGDLAAGGLQMASANREFESVWVRHLAQAMHLGRSPVIGVDGDSVLGPSASGSVLVPATLNYTPALPQELNMDVFTTTAQLLAQYPLGSSPVPNSAITLGRDTADDGGGAIFYYDATDTTTADNTGTIRVDGAGRRWKIVHRRGPLNVRWFGAKLDGVADDSGAWAAAIAALPAQGGTIDADGARTKANVTITKQNVHIRGGAFSRNSALQMQFVPNDNNTPAMQIGDGTTSCVGAVLENIAFDGLSAGKIGLQICGARACSYRNISVQGFTQKNLYITSSASLPTVYQWFDGYDIAADGSAASIGLVMDYGPQYVTVISFVNGTIGAQPTSGRAVELIGPVEVDIGGTCWVQTSDGKGVHFVANGGQRPVVRGPMKIDSGSSSDVLIEVDWASTVTDMNALSDIFIGGQCDGQIRFSDDVTKNVSGFGAFQPYNEVIAWPRINGSMAFGRAGAAANRFDDLQLATSSLPNIATADGLSLSIGTPDNGHAKLFLGANGQLWVAPASGNPTIRMGGSVLWTEGAGTPEGAVAAPVGSLFTRSDGGAATTLYVKESGSGNTGWVAK